MTKSSKAPTRRQPPTQHQFKAGQSGNPAGRPKGSRNKVTRSQFDRIFVEEAEREAPGHKGVSLHRAAVRQLVETAASGDLKAIKLFLTLAPEAEARVADLDDAEEARAAEAEAAQRANDLAQAAAERSRAEAAEDEALARRLAAEDRELYRLARRFAPLKEPTSRDRSSAPMRFTDAVVKAQTYVALDLDPFTNYDPFTLAASLAEQGSEPEEDDT